MRHLVRFSFVALVVALLPMAVWAVVVPAPAAPVIPTDDPLALAELALQLAATRQWALFAIPAVMLFVKVASVLGARVLPFLGTGWGKALLSLLGGTATALLPAALGLMPLSAALVLSGFVTAAGASGLFSMGKAALEGVLVARQARAGAKAAAAVQTVPQAAAVLGTDEDA